MEYVFQKLLETHVFLTERYNTVKGGNTTRHITRETLIFTTINDNYQNNNEFQIGTPRAEYKNINPIPNLHLIAGMHPVILLLDGHQLYPSPDEHNRSEKHRARKRRTKNASDHTPTPQELN